jgi:hypothetical protein
MASKVYKLHSHQKLTGYVKKFSVIEKNLLFEIAGDRIIAKTHTPDKSVVKIGSILVSDVMDAVGGENEDVKIGIFSVDNFVGSFKHFGENETRLEVRSDEISGGNVATEMKASSKNLKISFPCASLSIFRYIDADLAKKIVDTTQAVFSFRIDKDTLTKISALGALDSENDILSIESKESEVFIKGKSFELNIPGVTVENDGEISFYKSHLNFIDKEDAEVYVLDSKVIFKSLETDTTIVIGRVE